ncbi:MAG: type II toxin-antitoxin system HicB family antitoxin [Desulfovibrio sp.]|jgi:predicted HicB family RNase H-like nuclease|nr:type II toxin-antitoxin system HicB family antitoxin [Desulfovibrio sp.]
MTDNNTMQYKDYTALIEFSGEDGCLIGKVLGIRDMIVFDGNTVDEIRKNFHDMIDHYIAACSKAGREPNNPVSEVMIPVSPSLYAKIAKKAEYDGVPVHTVMETALQRFVQHAWE